MRLSAILLLTLTCALCGCTSALKDLPIGNEIQKSLKAREAGQYGKCLVILRNIDDKVKERSGRALVEQSTLEPLIDEHISVASALQKLGKYAAATRILHEGIAIECMVPQWQAASGPASTAYLGLIANERSDARVRGFALPPLARTVRSEAEIQKSKRKIAKIAAALSRVQELQASGTRAQKDKDFREAQSKLEEACKLCQQTFGPNSLEFAESLALLSYCLRQQMRLKESSELKQKALAIYETTRRKRNIILQLSSDLAEELDLLHRHDEAQTLHTRALELLKKRAEGNEVLVIGRAARNRFLKKEIEEANALVAQFREQATSQPCNLTTYLFWREFAQSYESVKDFDKAIDCNEAALRCLTAKSSPADGELARVNIDLARCKLDAGNISGAEANARQALKCSDFRKDQFVHLAGILNRIAIGMSHRERNPRCAELNRLALSLCERSHGRDSHYAISCMIQLSDSLARIGQNKESADILREAERRAKRAIPNKEIVQFREEIRLRKFASAKPHALPHPAIPRR
ncbi:MAG: tetratricopeptide repeat protein [Candidatus Obscuribacterales bacterium]|nr:tetratricopeptide repeat protein [Candidatus Obscuribacterales bacterium]